MQVYLDLSSVEDYVLFLKIKSLPRFHFSGRVAEFPDEYASLVGVKARKAPRAAKPYVPSPFLFDYQRDIATIAIRKKRFAVFMEPGMGKTLIDFEFGRHALQATKKRILIVAPLMVVRQMQDEYERFYHEPLERIRAAELTDWINAKGKAFGITNYEAIREDTPQGNLGGLIISESSLLKSHYGKWGTRLIEMGQGLEWKLCETGTPAPNDRIEYANHAVFLDQFPTVNSFLARYFVNRGQTGERWELKPHALRPFYKSLSHWCIFMADPKTYGWKDNAGGPPPIHVHYHEVDLTDEQNDAAAIGQSDLFGIEVGGFVDRGKRAQIANGRHNGKDITTNKPDYIASLIASWPEESTLVWCRYNAEQDKVVDAIPGAASISGDTPEEERMRIIAAFQRGEIKTLVSKPKVLGFGLNLQVCTRMVFSTLQDSWEEYFQAVKRANRYGSTKALNVHIPLTDLERPMVENVMRKARMIQSDTAEQEAIFREVGLTFCQ